MTLVAAGPRDGVLLGYARRGVWALPVASALLAVATLTRQPDPRTDFAGYADHVTTPWFLAGHLVASLGGGAVGVLGMVCLALALPADARGTRRAATGAALGTVGSVLIVAVAGVATFAQPAIGRAYRAGVEGVVALDADVYGPPLFAVAGCGVLGYLAGAVLLGRAAAESSKALRWPGRAYAGLTAVFVVAGFVVDVVQPVAALGLLVTTSVLAVRLRDDVDERRAAHPGDR